MGVMGRMRERSLKKINSDLFTDIERLRAFPKPQILTNWDKACDAPAKRFFAGASQALNTEYCLRTHAVVRTAPVPKGKKDTREDEYCGGHDVADCG